MSGRGAARSSRAARRALPTLNGRASLGAPLHPGTARPATRTRVSELFGSRASLSRAPAPPQLAGRSSPSHTCYGQRCPEIPDQPFKINNHNTSPTDGAGSVTTLLLDL